MNIVNTYARLSKKYGEGLKISYTNGETRVNVTTKIGGNVEVRGHVYETEKDGGYNYCFVSDGGGALRIENIDTPSGRAIFKAAQS